MQWKLLTLVAMAASLVATGTSRAQHYTAEAEFSTVKPTLVVQVQAQSVKVGEGKYPAKGVMRVSPSPTEERVFRVISASNELGVLTFVGRNGDSIAILEVSIFDGRSQISIFEPDRVYSLGGGVGTVVIRP